MPGFELLLVTVTDLLTHPHPPPTRPRMKVPKINEIFIKCFVFNARSYITLGWIVDIAVPLPRRTANGYQQSSKKSEDKDREWEAKKENL